MATGQTRYGKRSIESFFKPNMGEKHGRSSQSVARTSQISSSRSDTLTGGQRLVSKGAGREARVLSTIDDPRPIRSLRSSSTNDSNGLSTGLSDTTVQAPCNTSFSGSTVDSRDNDPIEDSSEEDQAPKSKATKHREDETASRSGTSPLRHVVPGSKYDVASAGKAFNRVDPLLAREATPTPSQAEKVGPKSLGELAVHKKKVQEVQTWLDQALGGSSEKVRS